MHELKDFSPHNFTGIVVAVNEKKIQGIGNSYGEAKKGEPIALIGSRELLEIAVNQGNAEAFFSASVNDTISLTRR